ncbi:DUF5511 family protein [Bacillus paramycoides]|uniref:DUF5511 family protein n=1 Tax=Bacillus paramycoides TaxID=2026194 RepID=UPI0015BB1D29|nr:DUF5511 family protein [Bacillus paramycoides]NWK72606.1 DUF5511 family protein [Bacillus paramycoides]
MSQKSLYMVLQVDRTKNTVLLEKPLFYKQVVVIISKAEAEVYERLLEETSVNESLPFVEYDEERGVICHGL